MPPPDDDVVTTTSVDASQASSPAPDAATIPPPSTQAEGAPSPGADQGEPRESLLDAVQQAVPELRSSRQDGDDAGQGASPAPTARSDRSASDPELPDDPTPEEMARYKDGAKRRVDKLINQRRELREQVAQLRSLEPSAKAADSVTSYLRDNDIGRDDFLMMLELGGALRRGEFDKFYAGIRPYVDLAEQYLGVSLPQDLQQRVREGHMTQQAAAVFARERMDRAMAQNRIARMEQQHQQATHATQQAQRAHQQEILANNVASSVNAWEAQVMQRDPDYAAKRAAVQDTMWAVVREKGVPQSPEHAVGIANEAYRRVNERYRSWTPPRRPTSRSPSSTGRTTSAAPEPKSLADAVRIAREGARL